jgi:DNA-binding GntR family transcriptional regulator
MAFPDAALAEPMAGCLYVPMAVYSRQSDFRAIERLTLADRVFDQIVEAIVQGRIAPGETINEVSLSVRLGVSRAPLREAIVRLEAKGLVHRVPHVGTRVIDLRLQDLEELFAIREGLEGMAARLAAAAMSDDDLDALALSLEAHRRQPDVASGTAYYQAGGDQDFHFRIASGSNNRRLFRLLCEDMYSLLRIYRFRSSTTPGRARQAYKEHQVILAALRRRDADAAEDAMRKHVRLSWSNTEARLKAGGSFLKDAAS